MKDTMVSMKALAFLMLLVEVEYYEQEYTGYNHIKQKQLLIRHRNTYIVVNDIQYPSNTHIMQEHSMTETEFKSIAC